MAMVAVNFSMNLSLVFVLQERGLALATAVCAAIQVIWLSVSLARKLPQINWQTIGRSVARMLAATGIMAVSLAAASWPLLVGHWISSNPPARLAMLVIVGVAGYALAAHILGISELSAVLRRGRNAAAGSDE